MTVWLHAGAAEGAGAAAEGGPAMARRRARGRLAMRNGGSGRLNGGAVPRGGAAAAAARAVPRILGGAVNGVEIVAIGALRFTRDVLVSAVSGAASIGAEALTATTAGARGIVSATSRMVGDVAGTAQSAFRSVIDGARHA